MSLPLSSGRRLARTFAVSRKESLKGVRRLPASCRIFCLVGRACSRATSRMSGGTSGLLHEVVEHLLANAGVAFRRNDGWGAAGCCLASVRGAKPRAGSGAQSLPDFGEGGGRRPTGGGEWHRIGGNCSLITDACAARRRSSPIRRYAPPSPKTGKDSARFAPHLLHLPRVLPLLLASELSNCHRLCYNEIGWVAATGRTPSVISSK